MMNLRTVIIPIFGASLILLFGCTPETDTATDLDEGSSGSHGHDSDAMESEEHVHGHEEAKTKDTSDQPYPLAACLVSGSELGSMGEPVIENIDGREVRFCCAACPEKFKENSDEYFAKMDAAIVAVGSN